MTVEWSRLFRNLAAALDPHLLRLSKRRSARHRDLRRSSLRALHDAAEMCRTAVA